MLALHISITISPKRKTGLKINLQQVAAATQKVDAAKKIIHGEGAGVYILAITPRLKFASLNQRLENAMTRTRSLHRNRFNKRRGLSRMWG